MSVVQDILMRFKVDTKDAEKGIKALTGAEKEAVKQSIELTKARNDSIDKWVERMANANQALELVNKALSYGMDAVRENARRARLETVTAGTDMAALGRASAGLKSEMSLLTEVATLQAGAFKLTNSQLVTVEKAMLGFTRAGFDQAEVSKKVTDAILKLEGDGLKELGIRVRASTDDADKFAAIMEALGQKAQGVDASTRDGAESVQAIGVNFQNAADRIKKAIGDMVIAMAPLIEKAAQLAEKSAGLVEKVGDGWGIIESAWGFTFGDKADKDEFMRRIGQGSTDDYFGGRYTSYIDEMWANGSNPYAQIALREARDGAIRAQVSQVTDYARHMTWVNQNRDPVIEIEGKKKRGAKRNATRAQAWSGVDYSDTRPEGWINAAYEGGAVSDSLQLGAVNDAAVSQWDISRDLVAMGADREASGPWARMGEMQDALPAFMAQLREMETQRKESMLQSIFGPVGDFDLYAKGFSVLTGAVGTAYDAWISGSLSAGDAVKKFIGESVAAVGKQMAVEAIKEGAYAIAYAFIDPSKAAGHAAAAAAFAAGSVVAGVTAKELGAGGSGARASGGGSGSNVGWLGQRMGNINDSRRGAGERVVYLYGDAYAEDSPTFRQQKAERTARRAMGTSEVYR